MFWKEEWLGLASCHLGLLACRQDIEVYSESTGQVQAQLDS